MKCIRLVLLVIVCLVVCICDCFAYDLLEYYPLTVGSRWEGANDDYATVVEDYGLINGRSAVQMRSYNTNPFERDEDNIVSYDSNYFYIEGAFEYSNDLGFGPGMYLCNPPLKFKRNLNIGETIASSTTLSLPNGGTMPLSYSIRLVRIESVTVPSGYFPDCLVLEVRINGDADGTDWWARGVGSIKECVDEEDCWLLGSYYIAGDYNYYLPYFKAGNGFWTGLGLTNRNQGDSTQLQVAVYDSNGNPIAAENKTIPAHGQDSFVVATQLNNSGWMLLNSHQPMSGLAFLGSWDIPLLMADIPFSSELSSCLVVPHIAQNSAWDTTILICNPNNETASIAIKYVDKAGVEQGTENYTIPASGSGEYLLSTVFSDKVPLEGSVEINSSSGIAAFALYTDKKSGGTYYAGINAESCE